MGLFSRKPVLPDYVGISLEARMKDPAWYDVVSSVPGFSDATLVTNADGGTLMNFGVSGVLHVEAGILTITPDRVAYAYASKHEIGQVSHRVEKAALSYKGDLFIMQFDNPMNTWMVSSHDHRPFLEAFKKARGYVA